MDRVAINLGCIRQKWFSFIGVIVKVFYVLLTVKAIACPICVKKVLDIEEAINYDADCVLVSQGVP